MKRKELNCFLLFFVGNEATSLLEGATVQGLCWNKSGYLSHLPHTQEDMAKVSLFPSLPPSLPPSFTPSLPLLPPPLHKCLPSQPIVSLLPLLSPSFPFCLPSLLPPSPPSLSSLPPSPSLSVPCCTIFSSVLGWHTDLLLYPTFKCTPHSRTGIVACTEVLTAQRTSPFPASCIHACTFISC